MAGRGVGCARSATLPGLPAGEAWARRAPALLDPTRPGHQREREGEKERRFPRPRCAARAGEVREARRPGCRRRRAAGEEEVVPAGARPGRGNAQPARPPPAAQPAQAPRPGASLAGRAPCGSGGNRGGSRCGPAARRSQQCRAGKTKGFHFASFPVFHLRSRGTARDPRLAGAAPPGARAVRAPTSKWTPASPPPPPPPRRRKARRTPACSDSRSLGIQPYCPRGAPHTRPG
ncbi:uncharacterized protein LOC101567016 [Octodon degus]|uniref:Uncharacterized protein LOC101567016 n=1 Tax=Octodon degus TaxID=10160 RepID=A0A6P3EX56_OCTDE|nr:uncharacterized protein LOC101567016 [Octodon degus]